MEQNKNVMSAEMRELLKVNLDKIDKIMETMFPEQKEFTQYCKGLCKSEVRRSVLYWFGQNQTNDLS